MRPFVAVITRDLHLAVRQGGATFLALVFFLLTVTLFPLGIGP
nr:heme exporter protein CcmB [Alphaproteobacteria bacterium]